MDGLWYRVEVVADSKEARVGELHMGAVGKGGVLRYSGRCEVMYPGGTVAFSAILLYRVEVVAVSKESQLHIQLAMEATSGELHMGVLWVRKAHAT